MSESGPPTLSVELAALGLEVPDLAAQVTLRSDLCALGLGVRDRPATVALLRGRALCSEVTERPAVVAGFFRSSAEANIVVGGKHVGSELRLRQPAFELKVPNSAAEVAEFVGVGAVLLRVSIGPAGMATPLHRTALC